LGAKAAKVNFFVFAGAKVGVFFDTCKLFHTFVAIFYIKVLFA